MTPPLLRRAYLTPRVNKDQLIPHAPQPWCLERWRKDHRKREREAEQDIEPAAPQVPQSVKDLLHVPPEPRRKTRPASGSVDRRPASLQKSYDAVRLIQALDFSKHLRDTRHFSDALQAATTYEAGPDAPAAQRNSYNDPGRRTLQRARAKLDFVGLAVERRIYHQEVSEDAIASIHCFSDSSPVTGCEVQGSIAEVVRRDGGVRRVALPAGSLTYSHFDVINKAMAFMWGVWMAFGPSQDHMDYFRNKVRSWTTDFGSEFNSNLLPNVIEAFLFWITGASLELCRPLIKFSERCFPCSVRICGWSHALGNMMKVVVKTCLNWPERLSQLRACCKFLRVHTWREWIATCLKDRVPNVEELMASFTATIAKWRYETLVVVLTQLDRVRDVITYVREEMFANVQDRPTVQAAVNAFRDARLWVWISVVLKWVLVPLENIRHWGMCCPCCNT